MLLTPVLETLDFMKTFIVECGASRFRIGAIKMQEDHQIAC
jgi:hypothetical protein